MLMQIQLYKKTEIMDSTKMILFLVFVCTSTFIPSISHSTNPINDGFVLPLIHRDSPHSPFYNHSMTPYERQIAAAHRSISRLNHLHLRATLQDGPPDFSPKLVPEGTEYVIKLYVGTPPTQVYAIVDTGSELIWIKGLPFFDPTKSFSYTNHTCGTATCNDLGTLRTCMGLKGPCTYEIVYADKSTSSGVFSSDKFTFEAPDRSLVDVGFLQFGYSNVSSPSFKGKQNGIVGLNNRGLSLINQLGIKKFSHCMTIPDDLVPASLMYFGSRAEVYGSQTPILKERDWGYYVSLEGISVGDQRVPIPPGTFNITGYAGGFIIDSGCTFAALTSKGFDPFLKMMIQFVKKPLKGTLFDLCFYGTFEDVRALPNVTFHFAAGADVNLLKETTFVEIKQNLWCLAIRRSPYAFSVLGNVQMRNFWVGYDLERGVISFLPAVCAAF